MIASRLFRTSCTQCGSPLLDWLSPAQAEARDIDLDEARAAIGEVEEVWVCRACGEYGVFGPFQGVL